MSVKNVKIRFNMNKENDRKAYEYLQSAELSYGRVFVYGDPCSTKKRQISSEICRLKLSFLHTNYQR